MWNCKAKKAGCLRQSRRPPMLPWWACRGPCAGASCGAARAGRGAAGAAERPQCAPQAGTSSHLQHIQQPLGRCWQDPNAIPTQTKGKQKGASDRTDCKQKTPRRRPPRPPQSLSTDPSPQTNLLLHPNNPAPPKTVLWRWPRGCTQPELDNLQSESSGCI